jgi:hypothetical protein
MLARMVGSHSKIYGRPEPHMLTPLAHLGYFENVDKAPFDHVLAATSIRDFVEDLPGGEQDYIDACRAYSDTLYERMLSTQPGNDWFLDKTPAYGLVLDFVQKIYPDAPFVVLTRHPLAIFSSFAESFFDSDYAAAHAYNPIVERYVPAIAKFLREKKVSRVHHVVYEELVSDPEPHLKAIFESMGLEHEPEAVDYGSHKHVEKGLGDPIGVAKYSRPSTSSIHKWATEIASNPARLALCQQMIAKLDPADLAIWGHPLETIWEPLEAIGAGAVKPKPKKLDRYRLERRAIMTGRSMVASAPGLRRLLERGRLALNVLLRE